MWAKDAGRDSIACGHCMLPVNGAWLRPVKTAFELQSDMPAYTVCIWEHAACREGRQGAHGGQGGEGVNAGVAVAELGQVLKRLVLQLPLAQPPQHFHQLPLQQRLLIGAQDTALLPPHDTAFQSAVSLYTVHACGET